jgi:hypothetical protein
VDSLDLLCKAVRGENECRVEIGQYGWSGLMMLLDFA